jgi:hypothetical protein
MAGNKKEVSKGWLHHATQESDCLIINSKDYKDKLKFSGYRKLMTDVLKDRELLEETKVDEIEGLTSIPSSGLVFIKDLSDGELSEVYDACDAELVKRGLLEVLSEDEDEEVANDK